MTSEQNKPRDSRLNPRNNPNEAAGTPERLSLAALMRAGADGELNDAQQTRLDAHLSGTPGDGDRVGFERELRTACGRAMNKDSSGGAICCPQALRARIEAVAAEARAEGEALRAASGLAGSGRALAESPGDPGRVVDKGELDRAMSLRATQTRERSFWQRSPLVFYGAAAAVLALAMGVLVWQAGTAAPAPPAGASNVQLVQFRDQVAGFVAGEHQHCEIDTSHAASKFTWQDAQSVRAELATLVGDRIDLPALDRPTEALTLVGGGRCHVPGTNGKSAHLRFKVPGDMGDSATIVSLFVGADPGTLPLKPGVTYALHTEGNPDVPQGTRVLAWVESGAIFYLVAADKDRVCDKAMSELGIQAQPEEEF